MSSISSQLPKTTNEEDQDCLFAMELVTSSVLSNVLKTVIELDILEIVAKAGPGIHLSSSQIASQLPTKNPQAPEIIDRMLRLLASYSILTCKLVTGDDGRAQRLYGLAPVCKYLTRNEDGVSFAPLFMANHGKLPMDSWDHFKDAVLEGGSSPLQRAIGMPFFEFAAQNKGLQKSFNESMCNYTAVLMKKILQVYKGFEGLKELVDVGGGFGSNLRLIVSKYPLIKATNFDLPFVIKDAPPYPGVDHVGGDMFNYIPKGEAIFMKWILHDWSDEECLKILKNCYNALPELGKVIIVELTVPEFPENNLESKYVFKMDLIMFNGSPGAKERTMLEFQVLAKQAGFAAFKPVCWVVGHWVIEFYKKSNN